MRDHVAHAVVPTVAAALLEAHHAGQQVDFIVCHQDLPRIDALERRQRLHRGATAIHESGRLHQPQLAFSNTYARHLRLVAGFAPPRRTARACQLVHEPATRVVARTGVLGTGVTQTDDELELWISHAGQLATPLPMGSRRSRPRTMRRGRAGPMRCQHGPSRGYFLASFFGASFFPSSFFASAPGAAGAAPRAAPVATAPSTGAAAAAAAASTASGSGSATRGAWIETTGGLAPCASAEMATPGGTLMSLTYRVSLRLMPDRSSSMYSGRSFGRQTTSMSAMWCETTPPWVLMPGAAASPLKWIGRCTRIFSFSRTRCRSTCTTALRAGGNCTSLTITACCWAPTRTLMIEE